MDIVGSIAMSMRTSKPIARRKDLYGSWGLRLTGDQGAGLHVVLEGTAWILPPAVPAPVQLGVGDVVFARTGEGYTLANHPDAPIVEVSSLAPTDQWPLPKPAVGQTPGAVLLCGLYALDRARPHPLIAELPAVIHLPARAAIGEPLRSVVDLLGAEVARDGPELGAAVPALLDLLMIYTLRTWYAREAERGAQGWARALQDPAIRMALERIEQSPAEPWTVGGLAAAGGVSRTVFARQFRALTGESPLAYVTRWRMMLAARLLRDTDLTLDSVAAQVGYGSAFAFGKAFKRAVGDTPGAYRREYRDHLSQ
ncbi:cupin domain-containing protein [Streptomyces sp. NPDC058683]|uniref:AraC family transcriptional regulator n=1 Tax=Streptomyces sp. NPDC058683 TaxID=3346597 RepID=UPI003657F4C0